MAYISPNSTIRIMRNVPLDISQQHQIKFATLSAQQTYFSGASVVKYTLDKQSYQRVSKGKMRVEVKADNLYDCNYLAFQNTSYGTKWFYAFIIDAEYVNNETSEITYVLDDYQTYLFDITVGQCFVEREHVTDDSIGANTIAEPIDCPEAEVSDGLSLNFTNWHVAINYAPSFINQIAQYIYSWTKDIDDHIQHVINGLNPSQPFDIERDLLKTIKFVNEWLMSTSHAFFPNNLGYIYEEQYTGQAPYITPDYFDASAFGNASTFCQNLQTQIDLMTATGGQILNVYQVPHEFLDPYTIDPDHETSHTKFWVESQAEGGNFYVPDSTFDPIQKFSYINKNEYYTPKNNKLYTSPYTYLKVINKQGGEMNLAYEKIQDRKFTFQSTWQNGTVACYMENQKYGTRGTTAGECADLCRLPLGDFPVCNFNTNGIFSRMTNLAGKLIKNISGQLAYRPSVTSTSTETTSKDAIRNREGRRVVSSTITDSTSKQDRTSVTERPQLQNYVDELGTISNTMIGDIKHVSSIAGTSSIDVAYDNFGYAIKVMQITAEYAQIIDNFFEHFGYAVKLNKVPNMDTRPHWNYVKTSDCYITGNCPSDSLANIIGMFNNGITFWKNPSEVGNYSLNNH